jgi:hypothetical protein
VRLATLSLSLKLQAEEEYRANEQALATAREFARISAKMCQESRILIGRSRARVRRSFELLHLNEDRD